VTLYWLGTAHLAHGETRQAEDALQRAIALANKLAAPEILASPAAEDLTLLQHGLRLPHHAVELARTERLAVTRQPWHGAPASAPAVSEPSSGMPRVEVHMLGAYVLHVDGRLVDTGARGTSRPHELLALLLLHPEGLTASQISELLWPNKPIGRAQANVQMTAYLLRGLLGTRLAVPHRRGRYTLAPELVAWSDLQVVDEAVKRASVAPPPEARRQLQTAVDAYRGDLLVDMPWDWVDPFRAHYRTTMIETLLRLIDAIPRDETTTWRELIERTLNLEPDNEAAFEHLLAAARARGDALTELSIQRRYTTVMERLGLRPNPRLVATA
jgi:DNA-binding SARP family transcriptional activator